MMRMLSVEEIMLLHRKLIEQTGGSQGVGDIGLIESVVHWAFSTLTALICLQLWKPR